MPGIRLTRARWLTAALVLLSAGLPAGLFYAHRAATYFPATGIEQRGELVRADPELGFGPAPNTTVVRDEAWAGRRYSVYTDRLGARVDRAGDQTAERVDLLTLGCSFAWGHGFENESTFTSLLRRRLGVEVANLAFPSWGTVQSLRVLERNLSLRPRLVVYAFIEDHLRRSLCPCAPTYAPVCLPAPHVVPDEAGAHLAAADMRLFDNHDAFMRTFFGHASLARRMGVALRTDVARLVQGRLPFRDDPQARHAAMQLLIPRMAAVARQAGATLIVVAIPYFEPRLTRAAPAELRDALGSLGGGAGAPLFLDLSPRVARHNAEGGAPLGLVPDGEPAHPGRDGHLMIADAIRELIEERGLLAAPAHRPGPAAPPDAH